MVNRYKIRRERAKRRRQISGNKEVKALFFDGRKNKTMKYDSKISFTTEENITLICEPNSTYLGHLILKNSSAIGIKNSIVEFLHKKEINIGCLKVIGCDGTNVNTGSSGGAIQFVEKELEMQKYSI